MKRKQPVLLLPLVTPRALVDDAERLDALALDDLAAHEPGQEPPRLHQPEPPEPEFDISEEEEWDGSLPWGDAVAE